jgi:hypothetical protein
MKRELLRTITALIAVSCCAVAPHASADITPLDGIARMQAKQGTPFIDQVAFLVTDKNGPIPGANVTFYLSYYSHVFMDNPAAAYDCVDDVGGWFCRFRADSNGVAILPGFIGGYGGTEIIQFNAVTSDSQGSTTVEFDVVPDYSRPVYTALQDMWWAGSAENGWGMSVVQHGGRLLNVIYAYDSAGNPTWWVMPAGSWPVYGTTYTGAAYSPRSSPFFAYDGSRFQAGDPVGTLQLTWSGTEAATLSGDIDGVTVAKQLQRLDIAPDTVPIGVNYIGDMWWGGEAQDGWGVAIAQQQGGLFSVWFTYDANGKPTWYVMPGGEWDVYGRTYSGPMIRTTGSPWLGAQYDPAQLKVASQGTYTLQFPYGVSTAATLEYSIDGRSGTLALKRQPF